MIKECEEDKCILEQGFSFTNLSSIEAMVQACAVDVVGVVLDVQPIGSITLKDGSSREKRSVTIGDDSKRMIGVTLWGDVCHKELRELQIVAFRACRISEYRGKSLNASSDVNDFVVEPDHPRAREMKRWVGSR